MWFVEISLFPFLCLFASNRICFSWKVTFLKATSRHGEIKNPWNLETRYSPPFWNLCWSCCFLLPWWIYHVFKKQCSCENLKSNLKLTSFKAHRWKHKNVVFKKKINSQETSCLLQLIYILSSTTYYSLTAAGCSNFPYDVLTAHFRNNQILKSHLI